MRPLLAQLARLAIALGVLYAGLLALSLWLRPRDDARHRLDTARAGESLYLTEPKYVFLGRSRLNSAADKVLVVGASNAMAGFKQRELEPLLPELEVHNVSVGGSNMTQLSQIVELVREVQSPEARRHDTWVLGLWYGVFASDGARWHTADRHAGDTDIDIERYRYGFFRRSEQGAVALLPPGQLDLGVMLIHPYLVLDSVARDVTASLRTRLSGKPRKLTDEERNARVIDEAERRDYLRFWQRYMGGASTLDAASFAQLQRTVDTVLGDGARVVLVDMPIPHWHQAGSGLAEDYRRRLDAALSGLEARPGVTVVRMGDFAADQDFSDEVHPKPRASARWAAHLAEAIHSPQPTRSSWTPPLATIP